MKKRFTLLNFLLVLIFVVVFLASMVMAGEIFTGTTTGTGSAINISTGFTPAYVRVVNLVNGTAMEWWYGFASAQSLKTLSTGAVSNAVVNGVSAYAGSSTAAKGFTIGADANLNASGQPLYYIAVPR